MTPAELITRKLKARLEAAGATLPVYSPLLEALDGVRLAAPSSAIAIGVQFAAQHAEPLPLYSFAATASLSVAVDDDKGGRLFRANYGALWSAFDVLARGDNCVLLGDELDATAEGGERVFAADGFQIDSVDAPYYQEDGNGGTWAASFAATVTGRAN